MRVFKVKINNFRGIKSSEIIFSKPIICLIGPSDATKSTILDAIEYVLSPNWFIPFDDSDFTNCETSEKIEIIITVGPIPKELMPDTKFGLHLRGWDATKNILNDEPQQGDINVLSIRLKVDETLTPEWSIITNRNSDGTLISYRDRQRFGITRIGTNIDNELAWTRGSSLLRLSADKNDADKILLEANRQLRTLLGDEKFDSLAESIVAAESGAKELGLEKTDLRAHIDPRILKSNTGMLSLHRGKVPFRRMGLGSRRLMAIGLQLQCIQEGAVLLIDEIEHALEPHRIKHVIRTLLRNTEEKSSGQVIMTSHSPSVLQEFGAKPVCCVHSSDKMITEVKSIPEETQGTMRSIPEAFLSRRIIVCEGATELGLLRSFEKQTIDNEGPEKSFAYHGVIVVDGGGHNAPKRALDLAKLKYHVCLFMDSDDVAGWTVSESDLASEKVEIVRWKEPVNTETRVVFDIPEEFLEETVRIAVNITGKDEASIISSINSKLSQDEILSSLNDINTYSDKKNLRQAIAKASTTKDKEWFKSVTGGELLGNFLFDKPYEKMAYTDFNGKLETIKDWVHDTKVQHT